MNQMPVHLGRMNQREWWQPIAVALAVAVARGPLALADPVETTRGGVVGYVEEIFASGSRKLSDVATIQRADGGVPKPEDAIYLRAGDKIIVNVKDADLYVRLVADGRRVRVSGGEAKAGASSGFTIPTPATPGLPIRLASFFKTLFLGQDFSGSGLAMSGSRGGTIAGACFNASGETNQPRTFDMPSLSADDPAIAPGKRELVVSWIGGAPPFSVEIADAATGKIIVAKDNIPGVCAVRLPPAELAPGHYRVSVTDANHASMTESHLSTEKAPPPVPAEIAGAGLPAETKELYAATWLAGINGGRWAFEALQRVSALDCRSPAVKEWLRNWGSLLAKCEERPVTGGQTAARPTAGPPPITASPPPATASQRK